MFEIFNKLNFSCEKALYAPRVWKSWTHFEKRSLGWLPGTVILLAWRYIFITFHTCGQRKGDINLFVISNFDNVCIFKPTACKMFILFRKKENTSDLHTCMGFFLPFTKFLTIFFLLRLFEKNQYLWELTESKYNQV